MAEAPGLGRLGRRLLVAFLLVALVSMAVLMAGTVITNAHSRETASQEMRQQLANELSAAVVAGYAQAGGWPGADLREAEAAAVAAGMHMVVLDSDEAIVWGAPVGPNFAQRSVSAPVQSDGDRVGTILLGVRGGALPAAEAGLSTGWFLGAAAVAALAALATSYAIARRITRPISEFIATAEAFAAGDHSARPANLGPPEFSELTRALSAAADEIEASERARRQLTAEIAHELRTPLTALQAGLEELRDGHVPADRETLAALHDQATRLGRIVNDLSELSAAESSVIQLRLEEVDLSQVAELALGALEGSMVSAGLTVHRELDPGVVVIADSDRMHQVVGNLLANAALYCRAGDHVTVRVMTEHDFGVLEVVDTGPGFRAEELPLVFDRAWRGASADGTRGSGLGLPIVRALVLAQGGEVTLSSVEGAGATISIRLPLPSS